MPRMTEVQYFGTVHCANEECPNEMGQGRFARLIFNISVDGKRGVTLIMCAPCADAVDGKLRDL